MPLTWTWPPLTRRDETRASRRALPTVADFSKGKQSKPDGLSERQRNKSPSHSSAPDGSSTPGSNGSQEHRKSSHAGRKASSSHHHAANLQPPQLLQLDSLIQKTYQNVTQFRSPRPGKRRLPQQGGLSSPHQRRCRPLDLSRAPCTTNSRHWATRVVAAHVGDTVLSLLQINTKTALSSPPEICLSACLHEAQSSSCLVLAFNM